jgi:hypothetical protein
MRVGKLSFGKIRNGALEFVPRDRKANQTVHRPGASRLPQGRINRNDSFTKGNEGNEAEEKR